MLLTYHYVVLGRCLTILLFVSFALCTMPVQTFYERGILFLFFLLASGYLGRQLINSRSEHRTDTLTTTHSAIG